MLRRTISNSASGFTRVMPTATGTGSRMPEIVARLFHDYGIRYFKIDGISLPDKHAEVNLRKFFE